MSDWYCPLPFRHVYITPHGLGPCCKLMFGGADLGSWSTNPKLQNLQSSFLRGELPVKCQSCADDETLRQRSLRTDSIREYQGKKFSDTLVDFVDFRSSNICNFRCRTCNPQFSHGIANDVKNSKILQKHMPLLLDKTVEVGDGNSQWVLDNLDQIKRFMFTGGEPTVIPGVRRIIQELIAQRRWDVNILITSNGSFQDDFWYEITENAPNIHWTLSVDAIGPAAEILRNGTVWATVEHNLRWMANNAPSLNVNTVISNLNILHLKPLLQLMRDLQLQSRSPQGRHGDQGFRHQFAVVRHPEIMSVKNLTPDLVSRAQQHLTECLTIDLDPEQRTTLESLQNILSHAVFDQELWNRSLEYNTELDRLRAENHQTLWNDS